MAAYLVIFRINSEDRIPGLVRAVVAFPGWTRLAENCFLMTSDLGADTIYDQLAMHLGKYDRLYVLRAGDQFAGQGSSAVSEWLNRHLLAGMRM